MVRLSETYFGLWNYFWGMVGGAIITKFNLGFSDGWYWGCAVIFAAIASIPSVKETKP